MSLQLTLKQWRGVRGISQETLAKKAGVTTRTIQRYEDDVKNLRKTSFETLESLAKSLDVSVDDIFLGSDSEKPKEKIGPEKEG